MSENRQRGQRPNTSESLNPEGVYPQMNRSSNLPERRQELPHTPNLEQNPEYRFESLGTGEQIRGQPRYEDNRRQQPQNQPLQEENRYTQQNHGWGDRNENQNNDRWREQNSRTQNTGHRENDRARDEREDRFQRSQEKERARRAKQENQDEAIRRILKETSTSGEITNTPPRLRDYGTYQAWRQKIADWATFEGKVAGGELVLGIIRTIREDSHEKSQTAKVIYEETWGELLQQSHDFGKLELIDFLKRLDAKMEVLTQIQIENSKRDGIISKRIALAARSM